MAISRAQYEKRIDIADRLRTLTIIGGQMANICFLAKLLYLLLPKWDGSHGWFGTPVINFLTPIHLRIPDSSSFHFSPLSLSLSVSACLSFPYLSIPLYLSIYTNWKQIVKMDKHVEKKKYRRTDLSARGRSISLVCSHRNSRDRRTNFETTLRKFVEYNRIQSIQARTG